MADIDEMVAVVNRAALQLSEAIADLKSAQEKFDEANRTVLALGGQTPGDTLVRYRMHCNNGVDQINQAYRQATRAMTTGQEFVERLFQ